MGGNVMRCLTTDSGGTTFYGLIFTYDNVNGGYSGLRPSVVVAKSNNGPANPLSITWSLVSKIGFESLTGLTFFPSGESLCAINSKGVFSFLIDAGSDAPSTYLKSGPRLYQYDPHGKTMDASFNYKGTGSWSNVTINAHPSITGLWLKPRLQYAYSGQVESLIFSFIGNGFDIELAVLNEATNTLAHAATWKMNETLYGDQLSDAIISGDHLFTVSEGSPFHPLPYVASFPISAQISANTPEGRIIDASAFAGLDWYDNDLRLDLASSEGTLYVLAIRGWVLKDMKSDSFLLSETRYAAGATTLGRTVNISQKIDDYSYFVPIKGQFALMTRDEQLDAITLSGASIGNFYSNISINIDDSIDPNSELGAKSSGESKTGLIVSVTVAVLVLIGAGIGYIFWRKRRATGTAITATPSLPPKDHAHIQGHGFVQKIESVADVGHGSQPTPFGQTAGYIGAAAAPPTTTATTMSGTQVQYFQNHMQDLQLSSHPRPNVVTTGGTANQG
ncbi:hypothetical protein EC968_003271 [Mortierella alpina]|nr:hypothetical protein EC968_003271 [Mortierella alpina]